MPPFLFINPERVYLYFGKDYILPPTHLDTFLEEFAEVIHSDYKGRPLVVNGNLCFTRIRSVTNIFANSYLLNFPEVTSEENMKPIITNNQFKKLRRSSIPNIEKKAITAHVFFLLYCMVLLMNKRNASVTFNTYETHASGYRKIIREYFETTRDELANYALECDEVITRFCRTGIVYIPPEEFPAIPRQYIDDLN